MGVVGYGPYYRATETAYDTLRWRSSIHMPRWASRIDLRVVSVRVERVQDIVQHPDEIEMEGIVYDADWLMVGPCDADYGGLFEQFADRWQSINGKRPGCSWEANPPVWCVEFERVKP